MKPLLSYHMPSMRDRKVCNQTYEWSVCYDQHKYAKQSNDIKSYFSHWFCIPAFEEFGFGFVDLPSWSELHPISDLLFGVSYHQSCVYYQVFKQHHLLRALLGSRLPSLSLKMASQFMKSLDFQGSKWSLSQPLHLFKLYLYACCSLC